MMMAAAEDVRTTERGVPVTYTCWACKRAGRSGAVRQVVFRLRVTKRGYYPRESVDRTWMDADGTVLDQYIPADQICPRHVCETCGEAMLGTPIVGTYSAEHKCGARCMNATGHNCECECGGRNHGKNLR